MSAAKFVPRHKKLIPVTILVVKTCTQQAFQLLNVVTTYLTSTADMVCCDELLVDKQRQSICMIANLANLACTTATL